VVILQTIGRHLAFGVLASESWWEAWQPSPR